MKRQSGRLKKRKLTQIECEFLLFAVNEEVDELEVTKLTEESNKELRHLGAELLVANCQSQ